MHKHILVHFLLLQIAFVFIGMTAQTTQLLKSSSQARGLVALAVHSAKKYPEIASSLGVGAVLACFLWQREILQGVQNAIRMLAALLETNEAQKALIDFESFDVTPYMPLLTKTPVGKQMLQEIDKQNLPEQEQTQEIKKIFLGGSTLLQKVTASERQDQEVKQPQTVAVQQEKSPIISQQQNTPVEEKQIPKVDGIALPQEQKTSEPENLEVKQQKTIEEDNPKSLASTQQQSTLASEQHSAVLQKPDLKPVAQQKEEDLAPDRLFKLYNQESHNDFVAELVNSDSSKLLNCFLLVHQRGASNEIKWCILDALAKRVITKDGLIEKTSTRQVIGDRIDSNALMEAFASKAFYLLPEPAEFKVILHDTGNFTSFFSPDNKFYTVLLLYNGTAKILNLSDGSIKTINNISISKTVRFEKSIFSPDSKFLIIIQKVQINVLNLVDGSVKTMELESYCCFRDKIYFSPDSKFLLVVSEEKISIINMTDGSIKIINPDRSVEDISFSPDSKFVAARLYDCKIKKHIVLVANLTDWSSKIITYNVRTVRFSSDSKNIVMALDDNEKIKIVNLIDDSRKTIQPNKKSYRIALNNTGQFAATVSSKDKTLEIINLTNGFSTNIARDTSIIRNIAFHDNNKFIVTTPNSHIVQIINFTDGSSKTIGHGDISCYNNPAKYIAFSADNTFVMATIGTTAEITNLTDGSNKTINHNNRIHYAAFSPDNKFVITISNDSIQITNLTDWSSKTTTNEYCKTNSEDNLPKSFLNKILFSKDNQFLIITSDGATQTIRLANGSIKTVKYRAKNHNAGGKFYAIEFCRGCRFSGNIILERLFIDDFAEYLEYRLSEEKKILLSIPKTPLCNSN